jgi:hypothetical protein
MDGRQAGQETGRSVVAEKDDSRSWWEPVESYETMIIL